MQFGSKIIQKILKYRKYPHLPHSFIHFRFFSDQSVNEQGFQIEFNALDMFTDCGESFSKSSGVLTSPFYPNPYRGLEECVYLISQPNGIFINISFNTIDINCQGTPPDYIEVRDGGSDYSPLMISSKHIEDLGGMYI